MLYAAKENSSTAGVMSKIERYKWKATGKVGTHMLIHKTDLTIDLSYQRENVSEKKVLDISRNWDWRLFGALSVVMRPDGAFCVYDGGHRLRAAENRDDIGDLPCMVFEISDLKDEANVFIGANTLKTSVSPYQKYHAAICAKDPIALAVKSILSDCNYEATANCGAGPGRKTKAIGTLMNQTRYDAYSARLVFELCSEITDGSVIQGTLLRPLFFLVVNGVTDILSGIDRKKLVTLGSEVLDLAISREKHLQGLGGERVEAKAIIGALNKGRKTRKLKLP